MPSRARRDVRELNDDAEDDIADSSEEEEDEESGSFASDGGETSSELDEMECQKRKMECLVEMSDLEQRFMDIKEQLYKERLHQVHDKLEEVLCEAAPEYTEPLAGLQHDLQIRSEVADLDKEFRLKIIEHRHECEKESAWHAFQAEKLLLLDSLQEELQSRIQKAEDERKVLSSSSGKREITKQCNGSRFKRSKRKCQPMSFEKKKRPVTITGPYIVYMLKDMDILEDWAKIKKKA
uniref:breast cancer metastasis-suppressor 1-like protein isoform X2 n=1 Tax=Myxine glutinosa TaxID=7769 RepID=UPI00358EAB2E